MEMHEPGCLRRYSLERPVLQPGSPLDLGESQEAEKPRVYANELPSRPLSVR